MNVFTIGCSTNEQEYFVGLLKRHKINCLVDVRSTPYSKYTVQFNQIQLKNLLVANGITYIWMDKEFGARREDRNLYTEEGYLDFEKVRKSKEFLSGVDRVKRGLNKGFNIALMCTEKDPIDCHRTILVAKGLIENGVEVKHILQSGELSTKEEIDKILLDLYFKNRDQINFDMWLGNAMTDEEMLEEAYRKRNKDIGYEIEGE